MRITLLGGTTIPFSELPENSIALDGAVQGLEIDHGGRRYSFDHHGNEKRFAMLATCGQVRTALRLGLQTDEKTQVFVNDIDADTCMAVWLLQNQDKVNDNRVRELTQQIGVVDALGPVQDSHPIHSHITPKRDQFQTQDMLNGYLSLISQYIEGKFKPEKIAPETGVGFGFKPGVGWQEVKTKDGFRDVYNQGYIAAVLMEPSKNGTTFYTVAKRSDFVVGINIGPATKRRDPASIDDYRTDTILGLLARAEIRKNQKQALPNNWGGGNTVGGSPRNTDGSSSILTPEEVLGILTEHTK